MTIHVVLLEDDVLIAKLLQETLVSEGLLVSHCKTLEHAHRLLNQGPVELLLVDRILGTEDGLDLVRYARIRYPAIGIIVLSGKGLSLDRIVGLESGADDYLSKPLDLREVVIRARRLAARAHAMMPLRTDELLIFQNFSLDPLARTLNHPEYGNVPLTGKEFDVLYCLARSGNKPLSRKSLLRTIYGRDPCTTDRTIDTLVSNIRRKLRAVSATDPVRTIRGNGYAFGVVVIPQQRSQEIAPGA
ncbi:MAG: response regulator transcription factor [Betaproteobacteria bacterium]|nr:response regulator transcription factor [Betaproteobacteria bacterium]